MVRTRTQLYNQTNLVFILVPLGGVTKTLCLDWNTTCKSSTSSEICGHYLAIVPGGPTKGVTTTLPMGELITILKATTVQTPTWEETDSIAI